MQAPDRNLSTAQKIMRPTIDPQVAARKIEQYFELCDLSMELALEGIKYRNPEADRAELLRLFAERLALFRKDKWRPNG